MKRNEDDQVEKEHYLTKEMSQLSLENQWLMNNLKMTSVEKVEDVEKATEELRKEKEKVQNLVSWKSQLAEKNSKLQEENKRYLIITDNI